MSMTIVQHVREKSQSRSSARTLLLNLSIYANDCWVIVIFGEIGQSRGVVRYDKRLCPMNSRQ